MVGPLLLEHKWSLYQATWEMSRACDLSHRRPLIPRLGVFRGGMAGNDPDNGKNMHTGLAIKRNMRPSRVVSFAALAMVNKLVVPVQPGQSFHNAILPALCIGHSSMTFS